MQDLGNEVEEENGTDVQQFNFKRKTFNLGQALFNVERNFTLRHAEKIDNPEIAFTRQNLFRKRRGSPKTRRNLLDGL